ncbi:MAG: ABC transporter substrate-binding protein [Anaerolineales bacterium]
MALRKVSRREFLGLAGLSAGAAVLGACAPSVITQTQVVKETQIVNQTQVVNSTEIVEVEITPTPLPALVTPQGRELPPDAAPLEKQIFFEGGAGEPKHLDVARDLFSATAVLGWGGEQLLRLDENQQIVPAGAESYKAGPNAAYWDFTIRQDAKWSDGTPITADDWVFTFRHYADPELDNGFTYFYYDIKGMQAYKEGTGTADDVGVTKVDDRTIRITGINPVPHVPAMMTYQAVVPAPKHLAENNKQHWADTMEGTVFSGQFKMKQWEHNKFIIWEQNEFYNGPFKAGVLYVKQIMGDGTNWFAAWQNHEVDMLAGLDAAQMAIVRSTPEYNPLLHWWKNYKPEYITFDTLHAPTDNQKLRMALAKSIDRETLCNQVLQGTETANYSMLTPGFPGYNPDLKSIQAYDVPAAQQLLSDAGYPGGKDASGKQLELTITFRNVDPYVEFIQEQWQTNLGISVKTVQVENSVFRQMRNDKKMAIFHNFYEYDFIDPANLLTALWKSDGTTGAPQAAWVNKSFDDLVTQAGTEADSAKRLELFQQAEKILVEDVAGIFLATQNVFQVWWPYIAGIHPNKDGNVEYRFLDISRFQMYIANNVDQYRTQTL